MKNNSLTFKLLTIGKGVTLCTLLGIQGCKNSDTHYKEFPQSFYTRKVPLDHIPFGIIRSYWKGDISDDSMLEILDGKVEIRTKPLLLTPEEIKEINEKGYLVK